MPHFLRAAIQEMRLRNIAASRRTLPSSKGVMTVPSGLLGLDASLKGNDIMNTNKIEECCPRFNPDPWHDKVITWKDKQFVRDHVTSIFHIPLNYGAVIERNDRQIRAAGAGTDTRIILTDENSLWGADVYIEVDKDVPNAKMTTVSGTFMTRVFEGPYRNIRQWIDDMNAYVAVNGKQIRKTYFYYTTCPKCAKKYGKNYVVILAEVTVG